MRFYTIETGKRFSRVELLRAGDDLMVGVIGDDGAVTGIPMSPFVAAGADQLGLTHLVEGTVAVTPEGPSITTFKRREVKGQLREPDGPCVILVKTTGVLTSTMFIDDVKEERIERHFLPAADMVGVQILAQGVGQFLLELLPGASFRIEADAGTLTTRWPGWDVPPPDLRGKEPQEAGKVWEQYEARRQGLQIKTFEAQRREAQRATG